jgi:hypothetical protein
MLLSYLADNSFKIRFINFSMAFFSRSSTNASVLNKVCSCFFYEIRYNICNSKFCRFKFCLSNCNDIGKRSPSLPRVTITRDMFLEDNQGRRFSDVVNDPDQPFDAVLEFFNDTNRQRRMEESEIHHDRPPLSGVVREFESHPAIDRSLADTRTQRSKRLRQAVGVVVRMIMQARGWRKTGRKGSLGVRTTKNGLAPNHNTGGLAFWFIRAERYEREEGMPFRSVRERCQNVNI